MSGTELARKILRNLTYGGNNGVRKDYVEHLTNKSIAFFKAYDASFFGLRSVADVIRESTLRMVDRTYNMLEPYVVHYNNAAGTYHLTMTSTAPDEILEKTEGVWPYRPPQELSFYRARFTTSKFSLVIRGSEDRIEFFIVPSNQIMRLSMIEDEIGPLMVYHAKMVDYNVVWEVEDKELSDERFERYGLLLFDHFVKENQQELLRVAS